LPRWSEPLCEELEADGLHDVEVRARPFVDE
jgi:hypothetical protein